tara:strand:+ start:4461 stop:4694 length:234 start_codon:yes stop_codon:yes gene_type:complete
MEEDWWYDLPYTSEDTDIIYGIMDVLSVEIDDRRDNFIMKMRNDLSERGFSISQIQELMDHTSNDPYGYYGGKHERL